MGFLRNRNLFVRANAESELIKPMFGPSGVSIDINDHSGCYVRHVPQSLHVHALNRLDLMQKYDVCVSLLIMGCFGPMNCESCEEPKNSFTAAEIGFGLIKSCGVIASKSPKDKTLFNRSFYTN